MPTAADRLVPMTNVASFKPGRWNGTEYTPADLDAIHSNFQSLSAGPAAHYRPYVHLDHDTFSFGDVTATRLDADRTLHLDAMVPPAIPDLIRGGHLRNPSIELFLPRLGSDGRLVSGFPGRDGRPIGTPVLKSLTLLGADVPGVLGLPPLSVATFRHAPPIDPSHGDALVARFSGAFDMDPTMDATTAPAADPTADPTAPADRAAMLAALEDAGIDTAAFTPENCSDDVLSAFLAFVRDAAQANPPGATPGPDADVAKFRNLPAPIRSMMATLAKTQASLRTTDAALRRRDQAQQDRLKAEKLARFKLDMTASPAGAFVTPAGFDAWAITAAKCDDVQTAKFKHAPGAPVTELDAAMAAFKAAHPTIVRRFHAQVQTGAGGRAGADGVRPEVRRAVLSATQVGRRVLARDKA